MYPNKTWIFAGIGLTCALLVVALVLNAPHIPRGTPALPDYGSVADFTLTNQEGRAFSLADLRGQVWVADIIFTRCGGPCPRMTRQMKGLQDALGSGSQARLVTLTTDPGFDTARVLKEYAAKFGADPGRWTFLTGSKEQIAALAVDSLKLSAVEVKPEERQSPADLFVHSTIFVLVDKQARLRGIYETSGDGIDPVEVQARLLAAIRRLEHEG